MDRSERYSWLKWLSDPIKREGLRLNMHALDDDAYVLVAQPMAVEIGGEPMLFASNGSAFLAVRARLPWKPMTRGQADTVHQFLTRRVDGRITDLRQFRGWLGRGWGAELPCRSCGGEWATRCPSCWSSRSKRGACDRCGIVHDCCCPNCQDGYNYCARCTGGSGFDRRPGQINNVVFDRALLARFLAHVDLFGDENVFLAAAYPNGPVMVEGESRTWRAGIMPLREPEASRVSAWSLK